MSSDTGEAGRSDGLAGRVAGAAKWSVLTQLASKLISPVTTMVLARLLAPADFGVVASATMVISLGDLVTDAGFQRYLVQHRFDADEGLSSAACVAFWTNLAVSLAALAGIACLREALAEAVGSPGWGGLLAFAALSLPLTSLSSVQTALYQRRLDFRTLFSSRMGSSLLILVVSVPLAAVGLGPWSMVAGTLASNLFLAAWLTAQSPWKPGLYYSVGLLRDMLAFGVWIIAESVTTWVNLWAGTFIIGRLMDQAHVGLYKTSTTMSNSITGVVTAAVLPVVFAALSEVQSEPVRFRRVFLRMQAYLALGVVPISLGVLTYHDLVTQLLLGPQWGEAALFFGLWTGTSCLNVVVGYMCSEAYRALGRPEWCALVQVVFLVPFLPAMWLSASAGFGAVTWVMPLARASMVAIQLPVLWRLVRIGVADMARESGWVYVAAVVSMAPGIVCSLVGASSVVSAAAALSSAAIYVTFLLLHPRLRGMLVAFIARLGLSGLAGMLGRSEGGATKKEAR